MRSFPAAMIACGAIGGLMIAGTIVLRQPSTRSPAYTASEEYGRRLMLETPKYLGQVTGSRLACASCHIDAGAESGELSLIHALEHQTNIADRINRCVTGNMNGHPLLAASPAMAAMIAWLHFLADRDAATGASEREAHDPPPYRTPARAPDPAAGETLFRKRCADCHGSDGAGLPATRNIADGYLFPPLWGPYSFNGAADMANTAVAAKFIKAKMPLGRPDLEDEQALDVAAFIESARRQEQPPVRIPSRHP
ncbi:MAG TPA: c-type cytochrome [Bryobacteraceae bacterium]|jgi:thiosulfate dehydrogenase|nr:c-type cytochrome [Bryobacteraceae bacterium]